MSDFQLDVDSPYPQPSRQELTASPRRMTYSQGRITYKHYGKYVERMIRGLADERNPRTVSRTVDNLARYMRTKSYEYNQEHPNNEVIVKDIKRMSGGAIQIDEVALNNLRSDYKQPFSARPQKGRSSTGSPTSSSGSRKPQPAALPQFHEKQRAAPQFVEIKGAYLRKNLYLCSPLTAKKIVNEQANAFRNAHDGRPDVWLPVVESEDFRPLRRRRREKISIWSRFFR